MKDPEKIVKIYRDKYEDINKVINQVKKENRRPVPDYCFLDMHSWFDVFQKYKTFTEEEVFKVTTLCTWQFTKTVHVFNKDLFQALTKCDFSGNIPVESLYRLPYYCIYIDLDGIKHGLDCGNIHGIWVSFVDRPDKMTILNCVANFESEDPEKIHILNFPLELKEGLTMDQLLEHMINQYEVVDTKIDMQDKKWSNIVKLYTIVLHLVLYICSTEPDIVDKEENPQIHNPYVKTKKGMKLLPANRVRVFNVGNEVSKKIQEFNLHESSDRTVKAHIRKAHWHGYWSGARESAERKFTYKWLFPMIINA